MRISHQEIFDLLVRASNRDASDGEKLEILRRLREAANPPLTNEPSFSFDVLEEKFLKATKKDWPLPVVSDYIIFAMFCGPLDEYGRPTIDMNLMLKAYEFCEVRIKF